MKLVCAAAHRQHLGWLETLFEVVVSDAAEPDGSADPFYLRFDDGVLQLCRAGETRGIFVDPAEIHRRLRGEFLLGRACGLSRDSRPHILDATAGLGVDGLALRSRGARLHMVERHPALWALLGDLLMRADISDVELTLGDSHSFLDVEAPYDVVYYDPMFAPRSKTALPGKRMQYAAALVESAEANEAGVDEAQIRLAQSCARSRVVLKRRAKDPSIGVPDWTIRGRSIRYDAYQGRAAQA